MDILKGSQEPPLSLYHVLRTIHTLQLEDPAKDMLWVTQLVRVRARVPAFDLLSLTSANPARRVTEQQSQCVLFKVKPVGGSNGCSEPDTPKCEAMASQILWTERERKAPEGRPLWTSPILPPPNPLSPPEGSHRNQNSSPPRRVIGIRTLPQSKP